MLSLGGNIFGLNGFVCFFHKNSFIYFIYQNDIESNSFYFNTVFLRKEDYLYDVVIGQ